MYLLSLLAASVSIGDVLSSIPHDGSAIVVYLLIALFIGGMVMGSRKKSSDRSSDTRG